MSNDKFTAEDASELRGLVRDIKVDRVIARFESAEDRRAARNIDLLVDALEEIEARGCDLYRTIQEIVDAPLALAVSPVCECPACIAHEALTMFRGQ